MCENNAILYINVHTIHTNVLCKLENNKKMILKLPLTHLSESGHFSLLKYYTRMSVVKPVV